MILMFAGCLSERCLLEGFESILVDTPGLGCYV